MSCPECPEFWTAGWDDFERIATISIEQVSAAGIIGECIDCGAIFKMEVTDD
jgi:hypothetical protein